MTIKWVKSDPLVLNGEPFVHSTRLTVRRLLELRASGYDVERLMGEMPELRVVGIARAYEFAVANREHYAEFFEANGELQGPGLTLTEAALV